MVKNPGSTGDIDSPFISDISFAAVEIANCTFEDLLPEEQIFARDLSFTQKSSFIAGRIAAHKAIQQSRSHPFPILKSDNGAPVWPNGFCGSIAHTDSIAVAAVGKSSEYLSVGVDIELISRKVNVERIQRMFSDEEQEWVNKSNNPGLQTLILLSAREAAFKALSPLIPELTGIRSIQLRPDSNRQLLYAAIDSELAKAHSLQNQTAFPVYYSITDKNVLSGAIVNHSE